MKLTTEVKTQIIIFHDKSKMFLTEQEADIVWQKSTAGLKGIKLNGKMFMFSAIAKILLLKDFYEQYPNEAPIKNNLFENEPVQQYRSIEEAAEASQTRFRSLLRGLKQWIDEQLAMGITPNYAIALFNEKAQKYNLKFKEQTLLL